MDRAALNAYFAQSMGNASIPPDRSITPGPYQSYGPGGEPVTITPLHPKQYEYLGLGAMVSLKEWVIAHADGSDLEKLYQELAALERKQMALEMLLKAKKLAIPDMESWRHPVMPWGWEAIRDRLYLEFPRKKQVDLPHSGKSQTGEGKKKARKFKKIHPKPVKIKEK